MKLGLAHQLVVQSVESKKLDVDPHRAAEVVLGRARRQEALHQHPPERKGVHQGVKLLFAHVGVCLINVEKRNSGKRRKTQKKRFQSYRSDDETKRFVESSTHAAFEVANRGLVVEKIGRVAFEPDVSGHFLAFAFSDV